MKNFVKQNNKKAFTLIEALVAISILMIAIASPMQLAQKGLSTASLSKDQMVAAFLVQDAIESVNNIRDEIAIRGVGGTNGDWLVGTVLKDCMCEKSINNCDFDKLASLTFCTIDSIASSWTSGSQNSSIKGGVLTAAKLKSSYNVNTDGTKSFLKYDYNLKNSPSCIGFTGQGICSEETKFTRYINIEKDPTGTNKDEAVVSVLVSWDSPLGLQKIPIQKYIYNYSENL